MIWALSQSLQSVNLHCSIASLSFSISISLFVSIVLPVFRAPVNNPFKSHLLCSLITLSIPIHGCHSCRRIKPVIPSLLSRSHLLIFAVSLPTLHPALICLPLPFSPISSLPSLPLSHSVSSSLPICMQKERDIFSLFMWSTERDCVENCLSFDKDAMCRICLLIIICCKSAMMDDTFRCMPLTFK